MRLRINKTKFWNYLNGGFLYDVDLFDYNG